MRPQRFAILAALSGTVVLAGWAVAGLAGHDSPGIEKSDAVPIRESFAFRTAPVNAPQPTAIERTGVSSADVAMADPDPPAPAVLA
ncbi:MAG: hypothetical protein WCF49_23400, partial [Xanthobacteraceae bacterium]